MHLQLPIKTNHPLQKKKKKTFTPKAKWSTNYTITQIIESNPENKKYKIPNTQLLIFFFLKSKILK